LTYYTRPPLCAICQDRPPSISTGWICARCRNEHPELRQAFALWPEWAKYAKANEERERRYAKRQPTLLAAYNLLEGEAPTDVPGADRGDADQWTDDERQNYWNPIETWAEPLRAQLGRIHGEEARVIVQDALRRLDLEEQAIVRMTFYEGMTERQIARALSSSQRTIHRRLEAAKERLRALLAGRMATGK
jgi:RNA polymerase sigma factor (sigma-70 family)